MDNLENQNEQELSLEEILEGLNLEDMEELPSAVPVEDLPAAEPEAKESRPKEALRSLRDMLYLLAILIVVTLLIFRPVVVSGTSMTNTLQNGDYLVVLSNLFYREPQQGDIIVASKASFDDGAPIIKRVIATAGQTVDIDFEAGIVYVDGVALEEPYTRTHTNVQEGVSFPLVVEEGCIFVLGDNRNGSRDSRSPEIGLVDKREVLGKAIFLFFPGRHHTTDQRDFGRIGVVD